MATKLFIGSLAWATNDDSLKDFFAQVGTVVSASVIMDRETNRSKGFGFVEMSSEEEAKKAVEELNGKDLDGRAIVVNEARPREDRPRGDGGGGGGYGGGNNRSSY
jgi:RNA recognition motif-containing protein